MTARNNHPGLDERGFSLVSAMLALSLLAVFAMVAASLAVNESRTSFNELVHQRSFLAADSGGETGIAWLMTQDRPPMFENWDDFRVKREQTQAMDSDSHQKFDFDIDMMEETSPLGTREAKIEPRAGYSFEFFRDHYYTIDSEGQDGGNGRGQISVVAQRLFKVGY